MCRHVIRMAESAERAPLMLQTGFPIQPLAFSSTAHLTITRIHPTQVLAVEKSNNICYLGRLPAFFGPFVWSRSYANAKSTRTSIAHWCVSVNSL